MIYTNTRKDRADANRPYDMSYALIWRIHDAVRAGHIEEPFTPKRVETWMAEDDIRKEGGTKYSKSYVATLLSNSYIRRKNRTNRNSRWLDRRFNIIQHVYEYWFVY